MQWPWSRAVRLAEEIESARNLISISDPLLVKLFHIGAQNYANVEVSESSALGISAVYRAAALISGTIASLPLKSYEDRDAETRKRTKTYLDDPGGPQGQIPFGWKQTVVLHLLFHGRAPLLPLFNKGGAQIGLQPVHPMQAAEEEPRVDENGRRLPKRLDVSLANGKTKKFTVGEDIHEILGMSMDGYYGMSVISYGRNSFGTTIAGDRAAANLFGKGLLSSGLATPEEDIEEEDFKTIKQGIEDKTTGWEHAGEIAFVNKKLNFTPWMINPEDAQFLQSRQFQIEEVARWFGVPPHLLMQTEKQTSWGTGVNEQNRGLARFTLPNWTAPIEQSLSRLLPNPKFCEFDFAGMERPTPEEEIKLLIEQVKGGIITPNEARKIRNLEPIEGGDELVKVSGSSRTLDRELENLLR